MPIFETFPQLETERLILRRITADDSVAWAAVFGRAETTQFLSDFEPRWAQPEHVSELIQWADDIFTKQIGFRWAITRKPHDLMIGSCGFHLYHAQHRRAEIGYELHPDYWRQGIMTEAISAVIRFGFEQMQLHRIEADVTEGNSASANVLKRLGFTLEGTWRDKIYTQGAFRDLWQFGLLETEYTP